MTVTLQKITILLQNERIACIVNIVECADKSIFLIGKEILTTGDLYKNPLNSSLLNIWLVTQDTTNLSVWRLEEVKAKLWRITKKRHQLFFHYFIPN